MAATDDAISTLSDITAVWRTHYYPRLLENFHFFGRNTNRVVRPSKRKLKANKMEVKVGTSRSRAARFTRDIMGAFATAQPVGRASYELELSKTVASNDFARITASLQVDHWTLRSIAGNPGEITDTVEDMHNDAFEHAAESLALHRHLGQSAQLATVKQFTENDADNIADATAATTGHTEVRIQIDDGPIAAFQPGLRLHIVTATGTDLEEVEVTDYNPTDHSFGVQITSDTPTVTDFDTLANNDTIYIQGEYESGVNHGYNGFGSWRSDTTIYGVNRSTSTNRWMNATVVGAGGAAPAQSQLDDLSEAMGFVKEDPDTPSVVMMWQRGFRELRNDVGENALVPMPTDRRDPIARMGFSGLLYTHPTLGTMAITSDVFAIPGVTLFIDPSMWEMVYPFGSGQEFEFLPDQIEGIWYRMYHNDGTNDGKGLVYKADGQMLGNDICLFPRGFGVIENQDKLIAA